MARKDQGALHGGAIDAGALIGRDASGMPSGVLNCPQGSKC